MSSGGCWRTKAIIRHPGPSPLDRLGFGEGGVPYASLRSHPREEERDSGAPVKPLKALIEGVAREYVHRSMTQIDVSSPEPQLCLRCAGSGIFDTGVCHMCDGSGKAQIDTDL